MKQYFTTKNAIIAGLIILVLFLLTCGHSKSGNFFGCNKGDTLSHEIKKTITVHDTTIKEVPKLVEVYHTLPGQVKWLTKTLHDTLPPLVDYAYAQPCDSTYTKAYFLTSIYKSHNEGGNWKVDITDSVTQNRIINRDLRVFVVDTSTKETTTLIKHKMIAYIGLSTLSYFKSPFYAAGIDVGLKGYNDRYYGGGVMLDKDGKPLLKLELKLPIKLLKHK